MIASASVIILGVIQILLTEMYNDISRFWKSTLAVMVRGNGTCIGSIGCYAYEGESGSVAMPMGVKIATLVAHIYFSICYITIISLHV